MTVRKTGLGRGLAALIASPIVTDVRAPEAPMPGDAGPETPPATAADRVERVPVEKVVPGPHQARTTFDEAALAELAASIARHGVVQPVLVRETERGYELIAGERRWRAAKAAGLAEIPAIVRRASDQEVHEISLIENLQRADLDPIEAARAFQALVARYGYTHEGIAERLGMERSSVANAVRLLRLPGTVQEHVQAGRLSPGHARTLLALPDAETAVAVARRIVDEGMTVRKAEALVARLVDRDRKARARPSVPAAPATPRTPAGAFPYPYVLEQLRERLATKVTARGDASAGVIEVHYYSVDELTRLVDLIAR
jgi:ParB family chromosome partitioning protein